MVQRNTSAINHINFLKQVELLFLSPNRTKHIEHIIKAFSNSTSIHSCGSSQHEHEIICTIYEYADTGYNNEQMKCSSNLNF